MDLRCNNNVVSRPAPAAKVFDYLHYILQGVRRQWPGGEATYIPAMHTVSNKKPGG